MIRRPPSSTRTDTLFPYTSLFRSGSSSIAPGLLRRPRGQFLAPDLGVVADVDREARVEEEGFDPCSVHEALAEMAQFVGDARPLVARDARAPFDPQTTEERRVGQEGESTCRYRWWTEH